MADNVQANAVTSSGPIFCSVELAYAGDTVKVPGCFLGIAGGSEGSRTFTEYVGGAGAVTAGVQRMTLASDDPAVAALQILDDAYYVDDADWTDNTSKHVLVGGVYQSSPHTVTDGDVTPFLTDANGRLVVSIGSLALPTGASTLAEQQTQTTHLSNCATSLGTLDNAISGSEMQVDVVAALPAGTNNIGDVDVASIAAGDNNIGNVDIVTVPTDPFGANADAASATGSISAKLRFIASTGIPITGTVTVGSHAVTNAGTFAVQAACTNAGTFVTQENGAALTALQLLDDAVVVLGTATYTEATSSGYAIGAVRRDADTTLVNTTNEWGPLQMDANGRLKVEVFDGGDSHTVDNNGTFAVQAAQSGTWNIGTLTTVTTVTTCSTVTTVSTLTGGGVAHDGADSGNPHKIGAKAESSPKGITLVADADRTDLYADVDGMLIVKQNTSNDDVICERVSNTDGASTAFSNFGSVASTHNCITAIHALRTDAGTTAIYVDFRDGTAGAILFTLVIPAGGGVNNPPYNGPFLFRTGQATALAYDVSAATNAVIISVSGYQSKA